MFFFKKKKKTLNWTHDAKLDNNWNSIYNVIGFSLSFGYIYIYICMYVCMYSNLPLVYLKLHVVHEITVPYMALF